MIYAGLLDEEMDVWEDNTVRQIWLNKSVKFAMPKQWKEAKECYYLV